MNGAPRAFAVVPAAGQSRRMGRPKLLLPWQAGTVLDRVLSAWRASPVARVVVVVDPHSPVRDALTACCRHQGAEVVVPAESPPDMKASLAAGLAWLAEHESPNANDAWLVAPADSPLLDPAVIAGLVAAHDPARPAALVPVSGGRRGHPVLIPWGWRDRLRTLGPAEGLRRLLTEGPTRELPVAGGDDWGDDLDTPADYQRLFDRYGRQD